MRGTLRRRRGRGAQKQSGETVTPLSSPVAEAMNAPTISRLGGHDFRRLRTERREHEQESDTNKPSDGETTREAEKPVLDTPQPVRIQRAPDGTYQVVSRAPGGVSVATPEEFLNLGVFGPELVTPGGGAFEATYTPSTGELFIEVRGNVNFVDGLTSTGGAMVAATGDLTQAATDGNTLPPEQQAAFLAQFQWDEAARTSFMSAFSSKISAAWGGQHAFHCTRPGWEAVRANVRVNVAVRPNASASDDHLGITSYRVPDTGQYQVGNFVGGAGASTGFNPMTVDSTSVNPNPINSFGLHRQVFFENNSAELTAATQATLQAFATDFQINNIPTANAVTLEGHASTTGNSARNRTLAEQRIAAVRAQLQSLNFQGLTERVGEANQGDIGADATASSRRVDLIVGSGEGQVRATHEFGHVLGLDDEYAVNPGGGVGGSGQPTGTVTAHDGLAKQIGAPGSVNENNDNIMSLGNTVQPQHYGTFGAALRQLTGIDEWGI